MCKNKKDRKLKFWADFESPSRMRDAYCEYAQRSHAPGLTAEMKHKVLHHHFTEVVEQGRINHHGDYAAWQLPFTTTDHKPIYCLMKKNEDRSQHPQPFIFICWCTQGEGTPLDSFDELPQGPDFYRDIRDLIFDPNMKAPSIPYGHILDRLDRLCTHKDLVKTIVGESVAAESPDFFQKAADHIRRDPKAMEAFNAMIEKAVDRSVRWARHDRFICAASFYTRRRTTSLLLPLSFVNDEVECVLVMTRSSKGDAYIGQTILTLDQAAVDASLVGMNNNTWLSSANNHNYNS